MAFQLFQERKLFVAYEKRVPARMSSVRVLSQISPQGVARQVETRLLLFQAWIYDCQNVGWGCQTKIELERLINNIN